MGSDSAQGIVPGEQHSVVAFEELVSPEQRARLHAHSSSYCVSTDLRRVASDNVNVMSDGSNAESFGWQLISRHSRFNRPWIPAKEYGRHARLGLGHTDGFRPCGLLHQSPVLLEREHRSRICLIVRQADHVVNRLATSNENNVQVLGRGLGGCFRIKGDSN